MASIILPPRVRTPGQTPEAGENDLGELVALAPCLDCLSTPELQQAKIYFMAQAVLLLHGEDFTNVNDLTSASACFKCLPEKRLVALEAALFYKLAHTLGAFENITLVQANQQAACYRCLDPKAVRAAFVFLLNELVENLLSQD